MKSASASEPAAALPPLPAGWAYSGSADGTHDLIDRFGIRAMTLWPNGLATANGVTLKQLLAGLKYFRALEARSGRGKNG